ncbi:glycoside hydrolase family 38 C-terminal domain-containing protein [Lactobacillus corticis]|uniref:Glycoside hydrolase, family 38 n=1 Tax=Lactobacillus corticis TaxID=2201249 RepID=A0A916VGN3_9LACO|nr:glycoside hydrolase family 38 C-terminal domain-containing protein [Lactobacillus corticis]GFZ26146.1 glycoside hydrolase, family 38 [Lactobacillus corticis]
MVADVTIVNHTHWDREWYFSDQDSITLSAILFKNVINELEAHPQATFTLDGQISILTDFLTVEPDMKSRVEKLVNNGQLQIGPWYTQSDALHTQGESILRNGIIGKLLSDRIGKRMEVGYLPDTFGFNSQLPVILNQLGLKNFIFWRGIDFKKTHGFYFNWESLGGASSVEVANMPQGYSTGKQLDATNDYVKNRLDKAIDFIEHNSPEKPKNILIPSGNDQMNIIRSINSKIDKINKMGMYQYELGNFQDFFDKVNYKNLYTYKGEFRSPILARIHLTCGSSRMDTKLSMARLEEKLINLVEPLMAIAKSTGIDIDNGLLIQAWKKLLESQAHDSTAGSVVDSVNDDILHRLKQANQLADGIINTVEKLLSLKLDLSDKQVLVFNPLSKEQYSNVKVKIISQSQFVKFDDVENQILINQEYIPKRSHALKEQIDGDHDVEEPSYYISEYVVKTKLPSLGYKVLSFKETKQIPLLQKTQDNFIEGEGWKITFENGQVNLQWGQKNIKQVISLVDDGNEGDCYDFSPVSSDPIVIKMQEAKVFKGNDYQEMQIFSNYKLPKNLKEREVGITSQYEPIKIILRVVNNTLDIHIEIENKVLDHRIRLCVNSGFSELNNNIASVPFGFLERENQKIPDDWQNHYSEKPVNISPLDNNVTIGKQNKYVTVYSNTCKEYAQKDGILLFTLLATTGQLGKSNLNYRPGRASGDTTKVGHSMISTPKAELLKKLTYDFVVVFSSTLNQQSIAKIAEQLKFRPLAYQSQKYNLFLNRLDNKLQDDLVDKEALSTEKSLIKLPENVVVSACYKGFFEQNALVIRVENPTDKSVAFKLNKNQVAVNALEKQIDYCGSISPYDVLTILNKDFFK